MFGSILTFSVGWVGGWCGEIEIKANLSSSQSCELKLELSLAIGMVPQIEGLVCLSPELGIVPHTSPDPSS